MMRNRGPRGPAMNAGSGLLGEGPGMGAGMKRMMAGVGGGGLLGNAPNRMQQPRSLLERPDTGAGLRDQQNMRGGLLERHDLRERQVYNQGGRMEQQADMGYYEETGAGYIEEQGQYQQEYEDPNAGVYDQGNQEPYDSQEADYGGYNYNNNQQGSGLYNNPVNNQRGLLEDPPVRGSLMGQTGLLEEPDFRQEERGMRFEDREQRYEERGLRQQDPGMRQQDPGMRQQDPGMRQQDPGMRQRPTGGYQGRGLLEAPAEQRGLLRRPDEQRGNLRQSRDQQGQPNRQPAQQRGLLDVPRDQRGLLDPPREHAFFDSAHDQRGLLERPGLDLHTQQYGAHDYPRDQDRGLMEPPSLIEMSEPPRPPTALIPNQPRGLMDTPVEPRGLLDPGRESRSLMDKAMNQRGLMDPPREQRGLMDPPRENRGPRDQRAPLDFPMEQRGQVSPKQQKRRNRPKTKQSELMEKADLQMKLLQQEKMREMEQMEQINLLKQQQQAMLLQHQQQHLQQVQQQQQLQEQLQIKQQMQQAEMIMNANKGQPRSGVIPSLLDMPTRGKSALGKRPNAPVRSTDNKRARTGPADRRDRRPLQLGRKDTPRDRSGGRRNDRNRRGRKLSRNTSPDYKKRDRKDSGSRSSSSKKTTPSKDRVDKRRDSRNDRGKDKNEKDKKEKDEKDKDKAKDLPKTEVTVTMSEEYDPAEPTEDVVIAEVEEAIKTEEMKDEVKDDSTPVDKMDVGETEVKKDEDKDGQQKNQEISLTVTVNKKGRSVNDAHQKDAPKQNKEKMYKCNVCSVECYDEESFGRHMNGKKHSEKMKVVMSSTSKQAVFIKSRLQAEEHLRHIEGQKRSPTKPSSLGPTGSPAPKGKALESHCKVCDKKFTGAYKDHKQAPDHKAREDRSKAGCKVCKVTTFNKYQDYVKHLQSVWHLKKMKQDSWPECKLCDQKFKSPRKFVQHCKTDHHIKNRKKLNSEDDEEELSELVTLDTIGFEDDSNAEKREKAMETESSPFVKPLPMNTSTPKTVKPVKLEQVTPVKADKEDTVVPETYDPKVAVGKKYVVPVSGFFCKLCHKFYNNESAAKVAHCQSEAHYEKLKKAIAAKRAKSEEKVKKMEISQPQFGAQSEDKNNENSPSNTVENGNQSGDEATNMEEPSQYDTAEESQDSTIDAGDSQNLSRDQDEGCITFEKGCTTMEDEEQSPASDIEAREVIQDEEADDKKSSATEIKQQRARRGGGFARGSARGRRGRK